MNRFKYGAVHVLAVVAVLCSAADVQATNLIINGDFTNGNTGFTSQYSYNTLNSGPELVEGAYSVVTKASDVHFAWGSYFDHTSGNLSGKYFVANASSDTTKTVWQSSAITVSQANTAYRFEAWISKIYQFESNPPVLSFQIGDGTNWTNMGNTASLGSTSPGSWLFTYVDGQFSSAGTYYVRLKNSNGASGGNDLGLDDIYFGLRSSSPSVGTTPGTTPTSFNPVSVPEPSTYAMALAGITCGGFTMWRRRKRHAVRAAASRTLMVCFAAAAVAAVTVAAPARAQSSWNAYNDFYFSPTAAGWGGATSPSATGAAWGYYMGNANGVGGFPSSIGTYLSTSQLYRFSSVNPLGVSGPVYSQSYYDPTGGAGFARYVDNVEWNGPGVPVPHSSLGSYSVPWFPEAPGWGDGPGGSDLTNLIWMQSAYLSGTSTPSGEGIASVLTWTAPTTRTYDFSGLFVSGNDVSKSAAVAITDSLGGTAPLSRTVLANDAIRSFSFSKAYNAGDVVQFQVGNNLSSGNIVGLQVSIVPEPSTWVMGLAGIACAGWGAFRRRKRAVRQRALAHPAAMLAVLFIALLTNPAHAVTIDMVTVGSANDTTGYGAVAYDYQIGKYDFTTFEAAAMTPPIRPLTILLALAASALCGMQSVLRHRRGRWRELLVAAATLLTLVGSRVPAADLTWDPGGAGGGTGGTGTWNTTGPFWNDAGTFRAWSNVLLDVGIFGGTAGTVTLGQSITASGLQFTATGYTVTGNTLTLSGGTPSITTSAGVTATIQSRLVGTAGLFISGAGTVRLQPSGATAETANTYSGGTVVSSGTLELSGGNSGFSVVGAGPLTIQAGATARALSDNALGNGNVVNLTPLVIDGGTFEADAYNHINSITMTGGLLGIRSGVTQVDGMDMRVRNSVNPTITTNASASTATISSKVRNRGPLTITVADGLATIDLTMSGTISGDQAVTKSGLGTLSWTAANDLSGAVNVTGGTLLINANQSAATGAVTVAAAGRLGGTGTIGGATAISGILAPGNGGIGTLSVANDVTWNGGQNWLFELGAAGASIGSPGTSDLLSITGVNDFIKGTGSSWTFDFGGTGEQGWYRLAEWTGGSTGFVATDFTATGLSGANTGEFFIGNSALYIQVVPEPASLGLAATGGLAALGWTMLRRRRKRIARATTGYAAAALLCLVAVLGAATTARAAPIEWVTVGNPGNPADTTGYGAVAEEFRIGRHEVTIAQYTEFLNAVAGTDPYNLYKAPMANNGNIAGILQNTPLEGPFTYEAIGSVNRPITYVSWFDAARFANWMHNGRGSGSTETGAYTLNGQTSGTAPARNPGAQYFIPTEDQWYKAAYYSPLLNSGSGGYFAYATQSNVAPGNVIGPGANQANYRLSDDTYSVTQATTLDPGLNYLSSVGAFTASSSSYGTFDQTGNVFEWNDLSGGATENRGLRGGAWWSNALLLASDRLEFSPDAYSDIDGFRLAAVPEPASLGLAATGGLVALGWTMLRRRRTMA